MPEKLPPIKGKLTREQIDELQRHPSQNVYAAAIRLGVRRSTIRWHLRHLRPGASGKLLPRGRGFGVKNRIPAKGRKKVVRQKVVAPKRKDADISIRSSVAPAASVPPPRIPRPMPQSPVTPAPRPVVPKRLPAVDPRQGQVLIVKSAICEICGEACEPVPAGALQLCILCNS